MMSEHASGEWCRDMNSVWTQMVELSLTTGIALIGVIAADPSGDCRASRTGGDALNLINPTGTNE